ncbi:MAG: hypothetical protein ACFFCS_16770 [Candidatus Hodarchaeota archaeon]
MRSVSISAQAYEHETANDTINCFNLAKELNFNTIKLWFGPDYYNRTKYNSTYLSLLFEAAENLSLSLFISSIPTYEPGESVNEFPYNETKNDFYLDWLSFILNVSKNYQCVIAYNFYIVPFEKNSVDEETRTRMRNVYLDITQMVHSNHAGAKITLWGDPLYSYIPLEKDEYDAYGYQPYSYRPNQIDRQKNLIWYHEAKKMHHCVFVDEVGFRTFDTSGWPELAICDDEMVKYSLIREYRYLYERELEIGWSYFMLLDRANGVQNDFGLYEYNFSRRYSANAFLVQI